LIIILIGQPRFSLVHRIQGKSPLLVVDGIILSLEEIVYLVIDQVFYSLLHLLFHLTALRLHVSGHSLVGL